MMKKKNSDGCSSNGVEEVRWERFLPRMMLTVMVVEADDSTRQIIVALLRKCSYNVVAVPDGLKAWEILNGKPHDIDLILTEVDLPLISGFALLTLIMEHEICKNVPVIMISSQDSINTVYNCMTRGAADYLVKPIRRNELTNLWQHVWRRQSSSTENSRMDQSAAQQKIEATSENDVASSHSNGCEAQSSCTKPDLQVEHINVENMEEPSHPIQGKSSSSDLGMQKHKAGINFDLLHANEARGSTTDTLENTDVQFTLGRDFKADELRTDANVLIEDFDDNNVIVSGTRDVTDLLGAFNRHQNRCQRTISLRNGENKFDSAPDLDLSLRRSTSSGFENHATEKRATLRQSNASAFTRYINRPLQSLSTTANACRQEKEFKGNVEKNIADVVTGYNYECGTFGSELNMQKGTIPLVSGQSNHSEIATSCPQQRVFPSQIPFPVRGTSCSSLYASYGTVLPPIFPSQSVENNKSEPFCQKANIMRENLDCMEDQRHVSSATDQSGSSSSLCNGTASHINGIGGYESACGISSKIDQVAIGQTASEKKNEENFVAQDGNAHWSTQREAALRKFRMKRKDRCFEKKVRYESRKKLAEQRPRVKGQFVRQGHVGAILDAETDCKMTNMLK